MTTLRPAFEITLRHGDHAVTLRASLRAAMAIDNMDGGFPAVLKKVMALNLAVVRAVILAAADDPKDARSFLAATAAAPLQPFLEDAAPAIVALIAAILPEAPAEAEPSRTTSPTSPDTTGKGWGRYFSDLFDCASGWLGWTPDTTWNASPAEIEAAFAAHVDHLVAVNASPADTPSTTPARPGISDEQRRRNIADGLDPDFDRAGLRRLKATL